MVDCPWSENPYHMVHRIWTISYDPTATVRHKASQLLIIYILDNTKLKMRNARLKIVLLK